MFKHQDLKMFDLKFKKYLDIFHPPKVVARGCETQLHVGEKINYLIPRFNGKVCCGLFLDGKVRLVRTDLYARIYSVCMWCYS